MKKAIFSLLLMAASVIGANAQGSATTAQNPQDVDVLYAKNLLAGMGAVQRVQEVEGNPDFQGLQDFLASYHVSHQPGGQGSLYHRTR